jgi:site-specific recombinase XerD
MPACCANSGTKKCQPIALESDAGRAYALANAGQDVRTIQDWLGHRAIQHTACYTELS